MPTKSCPYCFSDTGIRIIFYGMPIEEPEVLNWIVDETGEVKV